MISEFSAIARGFRIKVIATSAECYARLHSGIDAHIACVNTIGYYAGTYSRSEFQVVGFYSGYCELSACVGFNVDAPGGGDIVENHHRPHAAVGIQRVQPLVVK